MMQFDIPVVLFLFRRTNTLSRIIRSISQVQPRRIYLMCDQGRNDEECKQVEMTRKVAEELIDWPCEVIKNYAKNNRGVYGNIGLGAKWVFEREECAIFLEDDNLPEVSFFRYCEELLEKYRDDDRILWICGTNYLKEYRNKKNESYMFTRNLLPCGWASWSNKFINNYDFGFSSVNNETDFMQIKDTYYTHRLFLQEKDSIVSEFLSGKTTGRYRSWDYHMIWSVRKNRMFGISPAVNLIRNIGIDEISEHGGNNINSVMTKRFCEVPLIPIERDLIHPATVEVDPEYERKIERIITKPVKVELSTKLAIVLRKLFKIPSGTGTKEFFLNYRR